MHPVFDHPDFDAHEQVLFTSDPESGLRAIIAIHDTTLGPALGGCRIRDYPTEDEALADVLRLSRGMSYKAALAGLPLGGGKAVVLTAPDRPKTPAMLRAMGRAIDWLNGRYVTAEDLGSSLADMDEIATATAHVAGRAGDGGDHSPFTAEGVFLCLEAAVRLALGRELGGITVAVKGLGHVGWALARRLHAAGARLVVADVDPARVAAAVATFDAEPVPVEAIAQVRADVYAPCALGGDLSETTIPTLGAGIVCGAANNQLATPADGLRLLRRGVLYCPDYLVNAGGLISVARRPLGLSAEAVGAKLGGLPATLRDVLASARRENRAPGAVADDLAEARFRPSPEARLRA